MVSYENLAADPLRLMRGYRQAAQLKFTLSAETQSAIRQLAPMLAAVSSERVHSELDMLLSIPAWKRLFGFDARKSTVAVLSAAF